MGTVGLNVSNAVTYVPSCEYDGGRDPDAGFWATIGVIAFLVLLVISAATAEWYFEKFEAKPPEAIVTLTTAFSLKRNLQQLFKISRSRVAGQVPCLNGIRVISTIWVVVGHKYEIFLPNMPFVNTFELLKMPQKFSSMPYINALFAVDTFFVLSGFLVTYIYCTDAIKGRKFNVIQYYVYRYLRLTVPVAVMVLFVAFVVYHIGRGPQWNTLLGFQSQICREKWWTTLLYINNFADYDKYPVMNTCLYVSWYLSVDMQLSWVAPIVLLPLMRWPKYTMIGVGGLVLLSTSLIFGLTFVYNFFWTYPVYNIPYETSQPDYYFWCYVMPWTRAQPYLVGMALGWLMSKPRKPLSRVWALAIWLISTACVLAVLFTVTLAYQPDHPYDEIEAAFYNSLHRLVWGLSIAWVIYACTNGLAGPVNSLLSWHYWQPFSKLSYCVFLTHTLVIFSGAGLNRTPAYFSHGYMAHSVLGDLVVDIPFAILLYVTTEAPSITLIRKLFGKDKRAAPMTAK
ncbi:Hypothetical predicted protein [Cloeon dipterum]|uniref:Acyltransferase 3 domain-containing protein n=1 Tax=Cloeon dipterum TaxID=197152 RepID=A0A8S1E739_9INSE|nr:Hypothetical predicted protein [Cloeon dipterum]